MTIYALVNNLLSKDSHIDCVPPVWTIISQTAILQGGNPYFVPDFSERFEARLALAVKIGKLGKGIAPRFASRYVDSAAPSVVFVASDLLKKNREKGLPWTSAISYDRCLAIGKFTPTTIDECNNSEILLTLESSTSQIRISWTADLMKPDIEMALESISRDNTIKTGDIILIGIAGEGPEVAPELRASLRLNTTNPFNFNIR